MNFNGSLFLQYLLKPSDVYLYALWLTFIIAVASALGGMVLGLVFALMRTSPNPLLTYPARFYIWIIRGTPLLVQIVFLYTALAAANILRFHDLTIGGFTLPGNIQAGIVALAIHEGAYMAEIIRSGLNAVESGQYEAARSLGMMTWTCMRRIIFPQAFRVIVPALGNEFNILLKNTTLLSVIGVPELMLSTQITVSQTFRVFELYLVLGIYFLLLTTLWGVVQKYIERRYARRDRAPGAQARTRRLKLFWQTRRPQE